VKVAIFGAGALGAVYGVRLATRGGVDVVFVVRAARVASTEPIVIESVRKSRREQIDAPARTDVVPADADAILLAVGTEDLDALRGPLATSEAPLVVLTPMLPRDWTRLRDAFGDRVHAAMPNVVAYTRKPDGVVRYWLPPALTKIDEPRSSSRHGDAVRELTSALSRAGLRARLELGVHEKNPATTVSFIAIAMALSLAGSARALTEDDALLSLATRACREGVRLAHRIGEPEPWAVFAPALAAPWALRAWLHGLEKLSPEALFYAEEHFGRKLGEQHRVMIREMIDLAREKGLPHDAFDELARGFAVSGSDRAEG
jgi:2-dehydropantoate 2-reductase